MIISKQQGMTVLVTLGVLYAVHNFAFLAPVKDFMNFDQ